MTHVNGPRRPTEHGFGRLKNWWAPFTFGQYGVDGEVVPPVRREPVVPAAAQEDLVLDVRDARIAVDYRALARVADVELDRLLILLAGEGALQSHFDLEAAAACLDAGRVPGLAATRVRAPVVGQFTSRRWRNFTGPDRFTFPMNARCTGFAKMVAAPRCPMGRSGYVRRRVVPGALLLRVGVTARRR